MHAGAVEVGFAEAAFGVAQVRQGKKQGVHPLAELVAQGGQFVDGFFEKGLGAAAQAL